MRVPSSLPASPRSAAARRKALIRSGASAGDCRRCFENNTPAAVWSASGVAKTSSVRAASSLAFSASVMWTCSACPSEAGPVRRGHAGRFRASLPAAARPGKAATCPASSGERLTARACRCRSATSVIRSRRERGCRWAGRAVPCHGQGERGLVARRCNRRAAQQELLGSLALAVPVVFTSQRPYGIACRLRAPVFLDEAGGDGFARRRIDGCGVFAAQAKGFQKPLTDRGHIDRELAQAVGNGGASERGLRRSLVLNDLQCPQTCALHAGPRQVEATVAGGPSPTALAAER